MNAAAAETAPRRIVARIELNRIRRAYAEQRRLGRASHCVRGRDAQGRAGHSEEQRLPDDADLRAAGRVTCRARAERRARASGV